MPEILITPPSGDLVSLAEAKIHLRVTDDEQDRLIMARLRGAVQHAEMLTRRQFLHARWKLVLDRFPMAGLGSPLPFAYQANIPPYAVKLPHSPLVRLESIRYQTMESTWEVLDPSVYTVNAGMEPAIVTPRFGHIWPATLPQSGAVEFIYTAGYASPAVIDIATQTVAVNGPVQFEVGDLVVFGVSGMGMPSGLQCGVQYRIASAIGRSYTLTGADGETVVLGAPGAGTLLMGTQEVPPAAIDWLLLRLGAMFENREGTSVTGGGQLVTMPFVDSLLDPLRTSLP